MLQKILNTQKMSNIIKQNKLSLLRMHLINTLRARNHYLWRNLPSSNIYPPKKQEKLKSSVSFSPYLNLPFVCLGRQRKKELHVWYEA